MRSPLKFKWFLFTQLPSVWFWGIRVTELTSKRCELWMPFRWSTKNPFRSIYFAALSGAGELASGILCMLHLAGSGSFSMLVTGFEAQFHKKADCATRFVCEDGEKLAAMLQTLTQPGQTGTFTMQVEGITEKGVHVATFKLTWSFKKRDR
ncbi:DUF4442 domain-containing protein [Lunatimonas sp.]|uniref:PaaI family thioesterase n=1 Tax=Lunatimonas sp. TaxID=2060141 RepID=UPI00263B5119|nr:DUF4442 domain-containing protein [Lunatimonas sp.]